MKKTLLLTAGLLAGISLNTNAAGISQKNLSLNEAQKIAQEAIQEARKEKVNVSVVVLDRSGNVLAILKDDNAGLHTTDTAKRKAYTALTFKTSSKEFGQKANNFAALKEITGVITLPGGVLVKDSDGAILGSVGVGGAPSGITDENIATSAINKAVK